MKKFFSANKVPIIAIVTLFFITVIVGVVTRISLGESVYKTELYPSATLSRNGDYGAVMEHDDVMETLNNAPIILIVNRIESENSFSCSKSTVKIKKVVKGDNISAGDTVTLFEYNYFATYKNKGETLHYINNNPANIMNDKDDYLAFLYEREMDESYQKIEPLRQFSQYDDPGIISLFNISKGVQNDFYDESIGLSLTYDDVKEKEFICFSQKSLDNLNHIKSTVVAKYVTNS